MRKKTVNEKRAALKKLGPEELTRRILDYPNQEILDRDENGKKRQYPIGQMARRIAENDYQMSEAQRYTLIHHFAAITVPNMKVVGVTHYKIDASRIVMDEIAREGAKATYETMFILRPEPENPYDENAVMVLVHTDEGMQQIGYLNREFVAAYAITEEQEIPGYATDYSNGKFKNVSYSLSLDVEQLKGHSATVQEEGQAAPGANRVYRRAFRLNGKILEPKAAEKYVNGLHLADELNGDFEVYKMASKVERLEWEFSPDGKYGAVYLETSGLADPLAPMDESSLANSFLRFQMEGVLASRLSSEPYVDMPAYGRQLFDTARSGSFQAIDPGDAPWARPVPEPVMPGPHIYEATFQLDVPVCDVNAARRFFTEYHDNYNLAGALNDDIREDARACCFVIDVRWELDATDAGRAIITTQGEISQADKDFIAHWVSMEHRHGIGTSFEQGTFAMYENLAGEHMNSYLPEDGIVLEDAAAKQEWHLYQERFSLTNPVCDRAGANAFLEANAPKALESMKANLDGLGFGHKLMDLKMGLHENGLDGHIELLTDRALTGHELKLAGFALDNVHAGWLDGEFEDAPFASLPGEFVAAFPPDDTTSLRDATAISKDYIAEWKASLGAPAAADGLQSLEDSVGALTAQQMELSDFGLY